MNMFERAARGNYHFPTAVGAVSVSQLFKMPLTAKAGRPSLDSTARMINDELKSVTTESFVDSEPNTAASELECKLDIVKHVIASKQSDAQAAAKAVATRVRRQRILDILEKKDAASDEAKTRDELLAELEQLGG